VSDMDGGWGGSCKEAKGKTEKLGVGRKGEKESPAPPGGRARYHGLRGVAKGGRGAGGKRA